MRRDYSASDGTRLVYDEHGQGNAQTIVLCHGLGAGGAQFAADAEWFAAEGFRVLTPNLRGHGASGRPDIVTSESVSPVQLRANLCAMLDHAGADRVHWVGNSLGGILGLGLVAEAPRRFASLAIFGTALALNLPTFATGLLPLLDIVPGRKALAALTARSTTRNKAARPIIADLLERYDGDSVVGIVRHISRYDLTAAATGWSGPGLVLVGGRDVAVNRALKGQLPLLADRPNWTIQHLSEGGHCANLDATAEWRQSLLSFWRAQE